MLKQSRALSLLAAACAVGAASTAKASLLIYEPFGYTSTQTVAGQVNTTSAAPETWVVAGTAGATPHLVGTPGLTGPIASSGNMADVKLAGNGAMDRLNIPNAFNPDNSPKYGPNSTLYYSLLLNVPSITGLTTPHTNANANNDFVAGFGNVQGSQAGRPSNWNGELTIRLGGAAGTYNLGVRASSTPNATATGQTYWTGDLTPGASSHFIVVESQLGANPGTASNDLNSIWLDPSSANFGASEGTRPAADGTSIGGASSTSDAQATSQSFMIGAGIQAGSNPNDLYLDEIRVGNTWLDVTTIPEPTTIGLLSVGALGVLSRRRRVV